MYTKAEARYIPNGAGSTADMAHPTRTGDLVVVRLPAVPVRRGDAGHADRAARPSSASTATCRTCRTCARTRTCARRSSPAATRSSAARSTTCAAIDLAPTAAFLLDVPAPQHSQGVVRRDLLDDGRDFTPINIDRPERLPRPARRRARTTYDTIDQRRRPAARRSSRRCSTRRRAQLPGRHAAAVRRRQRRRLAAELVAARGHADDRRPERVEAGRDRVRQPRVRLRPDAHPQAAGARRSSTGCRRTSSRPATDQPPSYVKPSAVYRVNGAVGRRDRRHGQEHAGARGGGQHRRADVPRRGGARSSASRSGCAARGVKIQVVVIHEGATAGQQRGRRPRRRCRGRGRSSSIVNAAAGHDDRPRRRRPHAPRGQHGGRQDPGRRGLQRGRQLLRRPADGRRRRRAWAGTATRTAKNLGVAPRADVKAIVDKANADTLPLRAARGRQRVGRPPARQPGPPAGVQRWATSSRTRCSTSTQRGRRGASPTPAACGRTSSARRRSAGEQVGEITYGEMFAVLPFGNPTVIETLTYDQLVAAFVNGFKPPCGDVGRRHRPHAAVRGPEGHGALQRHRAGDRLDRAPARQQDAAPRATRSASSPTTSCSPVATATRRSRAARTSSSTGDLLLDVAIEYVTDELAGRAGRRRAAGRSVEAGHGGHGTIRVVAPALLERDAPLGALLGALSERRGRARLDGADLGRGGDRQDVARAGVRGGARARAAAVGGVRRPRDAADARARCTTRRRTAGRWRGRWPRAARSSAR